MARPSLYETDIKDKLPAVQGWAMQGLSLEQIAKNLGIHKATLCKYKNQHDELNDALKKGREVADYEVVNATHESATGYWRTEQVVSQKKTVGYNEEGKRIETTEPVIVEIERWYPANPTAQIFWLKNRMPQEFNDRKEVKADVEGGSITFNILPASQRPKENEVEDV